MVHSSVGKNFSNKKSTLQALKSPGKRGKSMSLSEREKDCRYSFIRYQTFRNQKKYGLTKGQAEEMVAKLLNVPYSDLWSDELIPMPNWTDLCKFMVPNIEKQNHSLLINLGIEHVSIWVTPTMLKKSIIDATVVIRDLLLANNIHNYDHQKQGTEHKVVRRAFLIDTDIKATTVSMYRPETKQGDPRIWFSGLKHYCQAGDELGLLCINECCYLINMSTFSFSALNFENYILSSISNGRTLKIIEKSNPPSEIQATVEKTLRFLESRLKNPLSDNAKKLLEKFRTLKGIPITYPKRGDGEKYDTDVGMAIEAQLGIEANSKKDPDYHGIELKSWRAKKGKGNRHALFTQVPDWTYPMEGLCHDWYQFTALVGYPCRKEEARKELGDEIYELKCTTTALKPNAQDLILTVDHNGDLVIEGLTKPKAKSLLVWPGKLLRKRLKEKHPETFWIECRTLQDSKGCEVFYVKRIYYTRSPLIYRFLELIESGIVTLDHMIGYRKKGNQKYSLSEKGPSWKIHESNLNLLFPSPIIIDIENHEV